MPANLTSDYLAAEQAYQHAQTHQEKIAALEQMLATLPKHKGTEKIQADLRRRLSQARKESQKKGGAHATPPYFVKREGAGQVVLIGPPNSGKSQMVCRLTHARPEVAGYPFTTRLPTPGMMLFENVQIQLVDTPPMSAEFMEPWMAQVIRPAHLSALVVDHNDPDVLGEIEFILQTLEGWHLHAPVLQECAPRSR
jgi:ribosome-interacting GTPase 1